MTDIPRPQLAVYLTAALAIGWVAMRWVDAPSAAPAAGSAAPAAPRTAPVRVSAGGGTVVDVTGAVRRPGVYRLAAGARVQDAVRRAGGPARGAQLAAINLAAKLSDGTQVLVPQQGPPATAADGAAAGGPADAGVPGAPGPPVNLNTATAVQLDGLDGVGPATAAKILAFRSQHGGFSSIAQLDQIPGIGPKKLAGLRPRVTV